VVGRDGELETIRNALDEARAGRGGCLLLLGEAGSGKTRLLREARQEALERDMSVLTGTVPPDVSSPAFGVLTQAIRSWTRSNGLPERALASFALGLHQILPEWPLPADPQELPDAQMRLFVLEGILCLLLVVAGDGGALVILDDLHAADPETFDFLNHATAAIGFEPLLIVGARPLRPDRSRCAELLWGIPSGHPFVHQSEARISATASRFPVSFASW
jgi:hypothetical protein